MYEYILYLYKLYDKLCFLKRHGNFDTQSRDEDHRFLM